MNISVRLTRWREHKGLSKSALAVAADTTPQAVGRLEAGNSSPSMQMLERIVDALGITMVEFYGPLPKRAA